MIALPGFNIPKTAKGSDSKDDKILLDGTNNEDVYKDGMFDSDKFEKKSKRGADGQRDTGPRRY